MPVNSIDWKNVRKELAVRRMELFDRFVKNPADVRLASEIRLLDEKLLECTEHMEREGKRQPCSAEQR